MYATHIEDEDLYSCMVLTLNVQWHLSLITNSAVSNSFVYTVHESRSAQRFPTCNLATKAWERIQVPFDEAPLSRTLKWSTTVLAYIEAT
jgi:hypothetical protein